LKTNQTSKDTENRQKRVSVKLKRELARLRAKLGLGGHLEVIWIPDNTKRSVHGEIVETMIQVYDEDEEEAIRTLKHEFIEYVLTNEFLLPRIVEAKEHRRSDNLIDTIAELI